MTKKVVYNRAYFIRQGKKGGRIAKKRGRAYFVAIGKKSAAKRWGKKEADASTA